MQNDQEWKPMRRYEQESGQLGRGQPTQNESRCVMIAWNEKCHVQQISLLNHKLWQ